MSNTIYYIQSFRYPEDGDGEGEATFESAHASHESASARLLPLLRQIFEDEYGTRAELREDEFMIRQNGVTICEVGVVEAELFDGLVYPRPAGKEKDSKKRRRTSGEKARSRQTGDRASGGS